MDPTSYLVRSVIRAAFDYPSDISVVDILLVNRTPNTLKNLFLDFAALGDLKLTAFATEMGQHLEPKYC
jgi:vesicle coat complex subunit